MAMDWRLRRSKVLAMLFQNFILVFVTQDTSNNVVQNLFNFTKKGRIIVVLKKREDSQSSIFLFTFWAVCPKATTEVSSDVVGEGGKHTSSKHLSFADLSVSAILVTFQTARVSNSHFIFFFCQDMYVLVTLPQLLIKL